MIEMQMCQQHIRNIFPAETMFCKRLVQGVIPMQMIMPQEFCILFVANAIVHKDELTAFFYQKATHGPGAEIVLVGGMHLIPHAPGDDTMHGASIQFE